MVLKKQKWKIQFTPLKFEVFFNLNPIVKNLQCTPLMFQKFAIDTLCY